MLKYTGNGNWLPGVPARDLSEDEIARYGGETRLIASGLYVRIGHADKPHASENKALRGPAQEDKEG